MYVSHLSLLDFRSYTQVDVELEPGINTLVGPNGQGKTNLVEAIGYVATLGSHRVAADVALIRSGASRAVVRSRIVRGDRASVIEVEITQGKANRARLNRSPVPRARDILGIARTVLFAPEDLVLVKGDPDARRRYLDELSVLLVPRMAGVFSDYDRILRQRGALLKTAGAARRSAASADLRTLDVWDAKLAEVGAQIIALRTELVAALRPHVATAYEQVSAGQGHAEIDYKSSLAAALAGTDAAAQAGAAGVGQEAGHAGGRPFPSAAQIELQLLEAMTALRSKEIERGVCLVGPHRDDLVLTLGGLPAKGYASHGESWSFALALRLASYRLLTDGPETADGPESFWFAESGPDTEPVLILDDVFAELDTRRRGRLAELVAGAGQVIITAAVAQDIPDLLVGIRLDVAGGEVTRAA
ncbi:DNA replication and repair protein RecF [Sanguibacter gelidistatuariae]|uniref:DNA replication and repair protein RecF n=1 Tax=Sanguibacter gelidistatuariae TaxID=1814289 RepID=A0A1G6H3L2_9MICO|nr:DNA replication/repair protein RecF [Sanguibacter gelidistatuariae]SDB88743.1 DNA replication and repair protein RecF [Sanguibacter gelidistatuariae]